MIRTIGILALAAVAGSCASIYSLTGGSPLKKDETIVFFNTSGHLDTDGRNWVVPIHGWIFELEKDSAWRQYTLDTLPDLLEVEPDDSNRAEYENKARMFLVDNERGKSIQVAIGDDPVQMGLSGANGHFEGRHRIVAENTAAGSGPVWIQYHAVTPARDRRQFNGRVQLIPPEGRSVISDIDDTIKLSNVSDKKALLANTFLKPFAAVPGMAAVYSKWAGRGAVFHYVSASPWQLYPSLTGFIRNFGFPDGSFYLKNFRLKDETFFNLFSSQEEYKLPLIERIFRRYPGRRFIMLGDGGEQDPEIFAEIARRYPHQLVHIFIRDPDPGETADARYRAAFDGIADDRWSLFRDGSDLLAFDWNDVEAFQPGLSSIR